MKAVDKQFLYKKIREKNEMIELLSNKLTRATRYIDSQKTLIAIKDRVIDSLERTIILKDESLAIKNKLIGMHQSYKWWRFW